MELGGFLSDLPADPQALDDMLTRQQQLKLLTRKYAADIDGVIEWQRKAQIRLDSIDISSEALDKLKEDAKKAQASMMRAAKKLSAVRAKAATKLGTTVTEELQGLAMQKPALRLL